MTFRVKALTFPSVPDPFRREKKVFSFPKLQLRCQLSADFKKKKKKKSRTASLREALVKLNALGETAAR